jgi:hypothetical protein
MPTDWSRDGRFIMYEELVPGSGFDLWVVELGPDGKPVGRRPWLNTVFGEVDAHFLPEPNPRWVSYISNDTGRPEVYIDSFAGTRNKIQVSTNGARDHYWRADGRELFFRTPEHKLMAVEVKPRAESIERSAPRELFTLPVVENSLPACDVAPDGQRFLVRAALEQPQPLTLIVNWPALLK